MKTKLSVTSFVVLCAFAGLSLTTSAQVRTVSPIFKRGPATSQPAPPPPAPASGGKVMPTPLTNSWPDYPTIVIQPRPFMSQSRPSPLPGDGPNHCWIRIYDFSVVKDLSTPIDKRTNAVRFVVKAGPSADAFIAQSNNFWGVDFQFHALSSDSRTITIVAGDGPVQNVRWFWDPKEAGLFGEVTIQAYKYYVDLKPAS